MEEQRDEQLWEMARRRARFQDSLVRYVVMVLILWAVWWLTGGREHDHHRTPWPVWPMLFLGIFRVFSYINAYKTDNKTLTEKEYERLKKKNP